MARTADLGWAMARCNINLDLAIEAELVICDPQDNNESDAKSITINGLEWLIALRELINDEIADAQARRDLAKPSNGNGDLTTG